MALPRERASSGQQAPRSGGRPPGAAIRFPWLGLLLLILAGMAACGEPPWEPRPAPSGLSWTVPTDEYRRYDEADRQGTLAVEGPDLQEIVQLRPGQSMADVGTGPGFHLFYFAGLVGPAGRVYAVDVDPNSTAFIRRRLERAAAAGKPVPNVEVVESRLDDCALPPASVDAVLLSQVHNYASIPAPAEALADPARREAAMRDFRDRQRRFTASLHRALRPGGRMLVIEMHEQHNPVADLGMDEVRDLVLSFGGFRLERQEPRWGQKSYLLLFVRE